MNPLNVYGETKMMGEEALRQHFPWHVILRISSVFGAFGKNLMTNMLASIDTQDEIQAVEDMTTCPTAAAEVAKALIVIAEAILQGKHDGFGTFHLCGTPATTRYEFSQAILDEYMPHTTRRPKLVAAHRSDFPGRAIRPPYSVLDCAKIRDIYGIEQQSWRDGLAQAMSRLMRDRKQVA